MSPSPRCPLFDSFEKYSVYRRKSAVADIRTRRISLSDSMSSSTQDNTKSFSTERSKPLYYDVYPLSTRRAYLIHDNNRKSFQDLKSSMPLLVLGDEHQVLGVDLSSLCPEIFEKHSCRSEQELGSCKRRYIVATSVKSNGFADRAIHFLCNSKRDCDCRQSARLRAKDWLAHVLQK